MKKLLRLLPAVLFAFSAVSCGSCIKHNYQKTTVAPTLEEQGYTSFRCTRCHKLLSPKYTGLTGTKEETKPEYSVLFIGNSYTYYNNLPGTFEQIAESRGYTLKVDSVTCGSYTLTKFADSTDTYGAQVEEKLTNNKYDIVFLQEQSARPATESGRALMEAAVEKLKTRIESTGAQVLLYETWGYASLKDNVGDYGGSEAMYRKVAAEYEYLAEKEDLVLSKVGQAFFDIYSNHPEIVLYNSDYTHPTCYGTYVAAMVHYATIYGKSVIGMDYFANRTDNTTEVPTPDAATLKILQQAAYDAVYGNTSIVTDEYKIKTETVTE